MRAWKRLQRLERLMGMGKEVTIPVIWDGRNEEHWKEKAECARRNKWTTRVIRIGLSLQASSKEEALRLVGEHKQSGKATGPVSVYDAKNHGEVLARWDPGLPSWLTSGDVGEKA